MSSSTSSNAKSKPAQSKPAQCWSIFFPQERQLFHKQKGQERQDFGSLHFQDAYGFDSSSGKGALAHSKGVATEDGLHQLLALKRNYSPTWIAGASEFWKNKGDVGPYQLRSTQPGRDLLIHPYIKETGRGDFPYQVFILAYLKGPVAHYDGWIFARSAQDPKFWNTRLPRPAFTFPHQFLAPMDRLPLHSDLFPLLQNKRCR